MMYVYVAQSGKIHMLEESSNQILVWRKAEEKYGPGQLYKEVPYPPKPVADEKTLAKLRASKHDMIVEEMWG